MLAVGHDADALPFVSSFDGTGVEVIPLSAGARDYRRERGAVAALCERLRPTVAHTHGMRPDVLDAPVVRRLGIPVVTTVHGRSAATWKVRLYEWLQYRSFRRLDAVVAVSRTLADLLERKGTPRDRISIIPNASAPAGAPFSAAEARRALGVPAGAFCIGWVGRLSAEKAPDLLISALPALRGLGVHAAIIGDGRERAPLERRIAELSLNHQATLHGPLPDAGRYFAAFDVFVLSSRSEGMPMVLFEAMSAEVPIVATTVGGVPEVVGPDEALLVPPEEPDALADAIRRVLAEPQAARRRAIAARERLARDFGADAWLDRYEALYRRVAVTAGRGAASRAP